MLSAKRLIVSTLFFRQEIGEREPLLQGSTREVNATNADPEVSFLYGSGQPINEASHHSHSGHSHDSHHSANSSLRSLLLSVALSLHSIFEGLAIGNIEFLILSSYIVILISFLFLKTSQDCKKM